MQTLSDHKRLLASGFRQPARQRQLRHEPTSNATAGYAVCTTSQRQLRPEPTSNATAGYAVCTTSVLSCRPSASGRTTAAATTLTDRTGRTCRKVLQTRLTRPALRLRQCLQSPIHYPSRLPLLRHQVMNAATSSDRSLEQSGRVLFPVRRLRSAKLGRIVLSAYLSRRKGRTSQSSRSTGTTTGKTTGTTTGSTTGTTTGTTTTATRRRTAPLALIPRRLARLRPPRQSTSRPLASPCFCQYKEVVSLAEGVTRSGARGSSHLVART
jgi:hypothetical protein